MDWELLWKSLALVCVFEGLLPFVSPQRFRRVYEEALKLSDQHLRLLALASMVAGLLILAFFA